MNNGTTNYFSCEIVCGGAEVWTPRPGDIVSGPKPGAGWFRRRPWYVVKGPSANVPGCVVCHPVSDGEVRFARCSERVIPSRLLELVYQAPERPTP